MDGDRVFEGKFRRSTVATTLNQAEAHLKTIQYKLHGRAIHAEVSKYCRTEGWIPVSPQGLSATKSQFIMPPAQPAQRDLIFISYAAEEMIFAKWLARKYWPPEMNLDSETFSSRQKGKLGLGSPEQSSP